MRSVIALVLTLGVAGQQAQPRKKAFTGARPCDNSVIMGIEGAYDKDLDFGYSGTMSVLPAAQRTEALRRLDAVHQLLVEAYPRPLGQEADWRRGLTQFEFAPGVTTVALTYESKFNYYVCMRAGTGDVGYFGDNNTFFIVRLNDWSLLQSDMARDTLRIGGRPVIRLNPVIGSWKGYDLHAYHESHNRRSVVITRKGESPYTPVTREQYLVYQLTWLPAFFDEALTGLKRMPGNLTDAINRLTIAKDAAIKRHEQELDKSRSQGLLKSPAIVLVAALDESTPIFISPMEVGAQLLVTANPSYLRKDLPPYVPQFIVMTWTWNEGSTSLIGGIQGARFRRILEADFPVEKLQAMIDK